MGKTSIEWTDQSLHPIAAYEITTGKRGWFCVHVSDGCRFCYAERINSWRGNRLAYSAQNLGKIEFRVVHKILEEPLHWKQLLRCFAFDVTDWALIAERSPELMDQWFAVMSLTPHISYQMLTKRPELAQEYLTGIARRSSRLASLRAELGLKFKSANACGGWPGWPLQNVWLGVSVENQQTADERIPLSLQTSATVRFVSYEPALGAG